MKVPPQRSCIVSTSTLFQLAESAELKLTEMKTKRLLLASYRKDLHGETNGFEDKALEIDQDNNNNKFYLHDCKFVTILQKRTTY